VTSTHIIYCHTLSYIIRSSSYAIHTLFGGPREFECFDCWTLKCQNQVCEERRNGVSTVSYDVVKCNMSRYPNMHYHALEWLINWYISDRWKNNLAGPAMSSLRAQCTCCLFASLLFRTEDPRKSGEIIKKLFSDKNNHEELPPKKRRNVGKLWPFWFSVSRLLHLVLVLLAAAVALHPEHLELRTVWTVGRQHTCRHGQSRAVPIETHCGIQQSRILCVCVNSWGMIFSILCFRSEALRTYTYTILCIRDLHWLLLPTNIAQICNHVWGI
jgi:hypothetical protein